jgi:hypothetical protein
MKRRLFFGQVSREQAPREENPANFCKYVIIKAFRL